jgi:hypothetical protein
MLAAASSNALCESISADRFTPLMFSRTPGNDFRHNSLEIDINNFLGSSASHGISVAGPLGVVCDYIDEAVPVLARMSENRIKGYRSLGYSRGMKEQTAGAEGSDEGGFAASIAIDDFQ